MKDRGWNFAKASGGRERENTQSSKNEKQPGCRRQPGCDGFQISSEGGQIGWLSAVSLRTGTADQVIVVDVDHFLGLVLGSEWNGPVRPRDLVIIDRAFVVAAMMPGRADHRVEAAFSQAVDDRFDDDAHVVAGDFGDEGHSP